MRRGDVVITCHTSTSPQRLWNVFKINLLPLHHISAESTKKPACETSPKFSGEYFGHLRMQMRIVYFLFTCEIHHTRHLRAI